MQRGFGIVVEDKDHVELFQPKLNALEGCNFDIAKSDDDKRRLGELDQALHCRVQLDVGTAGNTLETHVGEWDVDLQFLANL